MLLVQTLQHDHLLFEDGTVLVLLLDVVGQRTTREGESHDTDEHDEDTDYLLEEGMRRVVTITDRRDGGYCKVEACQVEVVLVHGLLLVASHPRVRIALVHLRCDDPDAADDVRDHDEVAHEHEQPLESHVDLQRLLHVGHQALGLLLLKLCKPK